MLGSRPLRFSITHLAWLTAEESTQVPANDTKAKARPVTIFLDNARYQHCAAVKSLALELELEFLPPDSPNLNLIERLWKFVKKECLYSQYYPDFAAFKSGILGCLAQTKERYKADLDTLLTLKFQTF